MLGLRLGLLLGCLSCAWAQDVIGAGAGGLATALEAAHRGARVTVVDLASVFGGHAVMSEGGLSFGGSPLQKSRGIADSPDLMYADILRQGEDADHYWARTYADRSLVEVHDWLVSRGVRFTGVLLFPGNSVPRFHENPKRGFGIVEPLYRESLRTGRIQFVWNTRITRLLTDHGRVVGVDGTNERTGQPYSAKAPAIVLATGGFQSNLELVRRNWPDKTSAVPPILIGAGVNAMGSGLELARGAGAVLDRLDHQWNYPRGIPDPRYPGANRGLHVIVAQSFLWLDARGEPVQVERLGDLLELPGGQVWLLFDQPGRSAFRVSGTDWADRTKVENLLLDNPAVTLQAQTIEEVARKAGIPAKAVSLSVERNNANASPGRLTITQPPFHVVPLFPLTRKSMGGIAIDNECRALNSERKPVPGLYAVGEAAGFGGLNGKAAIEGSFIAPAILQGRIVGRLLTRSFEGHAAPSPSDSEPRAERTGPEAKCLTCHNIEKLIAAPRKGYWHFERVHQAVLTRKLECRGCHTEMSPFRAASHKIDRLTQIENCGHCHLPQGS